MKRMIFKSLFGLLAIGLVVFACSKQDVDPELKLKGMELEAEECDYPVNPVASEPESYEEYTPYIINGANEGGNRTCEEAGCYSEEIAKFDTEFEPEKAGYVGPLPFEKTDGPITWGTVDGTYVWWKYTGNHNGLAVIVKGGQGGANVYYYPAGVNADSLLAAPPTGQNQNIAGLSNITFCYTPAPPDECYDDETAWAATAIGANKYNTQRGGNWATSVPYAAGGTVNLYAGQNIFVGTVKFDEVDLVNNKVKLVFDLGANKLQTVDEPVKIQHYAAKPSGNPSPGQFANKFADLDDVWVPIAAWYGIHLDVDVLVECEEE